MKRIENHLVKQGEISLRVLLGGLEKEKEDRKSVPNVYAVRAKNSNLQDFDPDRLIARLQAIKSIIGPRWMEVEQTGAVRLHQTADQIIIEIERNVDGLDA